MNASSIEWTEEHQANSEPDFCGKWIAIEDKLPNNGLVLVVNEHGQIVVGSYEICHNGPAWRIGNDEVSWDFDYNYEYQVTHWMPLPDKPDV